MGTTAMNSWTVLFQILLGIVGIGTLTLVVIMLLGWVMADAEQRGKSGFLAVLFVLVFQVPGLLIWLVFRPTRTNSRLRNSA
jgi:hypothetical protein